MKLLKSGLIAAVALSIVSRVALPALAERINIGTPLRRGTEFDATPWEWDGKNWTEAQA